MIFIMLFVTIKIREIKNNINILDQSAKNKIFYFVSSYYSFNKICR